MVTNQVELSISTQFAKHIRKRNLVQFSFKRFACAIRNMHHDFVDIFPNRTFPGRAVRMRTENLTLSYCVANLAKRYAFRVTLQNRTSARTAQSGNEPGFLEFYENPPDDYRVCIDRFREPGRRVTMLSLQSQNSHHMDREGEPAILHRKV
jgi:hypothetical protein